MSRYLLPLLFIASSWVAAQPPAEQGGFNDLLAEGELVFRRPEGFVELPPGRTPMLDYECALRSPEGDLEIRLAVRPLKRLRIDYDDPHGSVPDPNHIFPLVFESLASRLAGGGHAPSNPYPPEQAHARFNADWAAAAVFDTVPDFTTGHSQGLLVAIHRNKVSDAYMVFLFSDYEAVKARLNAALGTLTFSPPSQTVGAGKVESPG
ncbi:MAG: hypothetical protein R3E46_08595 [Sedimenticolaceae bacterium]